MRSAGEYTSTPTTKVDASITPGRSTQEESGLPFANGAWSLKCNAPLFAGKCVDFGQWASVSPAGMKIGGPVSMFDCHYSSWQLFTRSSLYEIKGVFVALLLPHK